MKQFSALSLCAALLACSAPTPPPQGDAGSDIVDAGPLMPMARIEDMQVLEDTNPDPRIVEVRLRAAPAEVQIAEGALTRVLAYNGIVPGPLLHARVGDRVIVHFENGLAEETTVHWHGLRISDQQDGSPRIQAPIPAGGSFTYDFVVPDAGTYWYHTHMGQIQQMERGLYGAIVVHENPAPAFNAERYFVIDDIRLSATNQVGAFLTSGPDIGRGRVGNTILCSGREIPCRATAPRGRVERWRVVNAGNALSYPIYIEGATWRLIGTDGGLLPTPLEVRDVVLATGGRYDFEVRFDQDAEPAVHLRTDLQVSNAAGTISTQTFTFATVTLEGREAPIEPTYPTVVLPNTETTAAERRWALSGAVTDAGVQFTINGMAGHGHARGPLEQYRQGEPMRFVISADVSPEHPFHLHGQFFQVVARDGFVVTDEPGLRDTVLVRGRESVTILTYFENPGAWMYHCHIGEHSENGMMAELEVLRR